MYPLKSEKGITTNKNIIYNYLRFQISHGKLNSGRYIIQIWHKEECPDRAVYVVVNGEETYRNPKTPTYLLEFSQSIAKILWNNYKTKGDICISDLY